MPVNPGLKSFFNFFILLTRFTNGNIVRLSKSKAIRDSNSVALSGFGGIINVVISGKGGGAWHVVLSSNSIRIFPGKHSEPRGVVELSVDEFFKLLTGKSTFVTAYFTGRVRVSGEGHSGLPLRGIITHIQEARRQRGLRGAMVRRWANYIVKKSQTGYTFE